jgi:uncharacterized protein (DUF736 family)
MAFQQRDNSGSLFKNDQKTTDNHPDFKGRIMVAGKHYWISGWRKTSEGGKPWISLAVKPNEQQSQEQDNGGF